MNKNAIVAQRLKRMVSIISKLHREKNMKLSTMQDIGGLRAVVSNLKKVRTLEKDFKSSQFRHELIKCYDYIKFPKSSGYRSVHLVYGYKNNHRPQYDNLRIEIQIRTHLQHAFATTVETMGVFLRHSLKSSEGPKKWLDFFSLVGAAFAHLENSPPVPGFKNMTKLQIFSEVTKKFRELEVEKTMLGFNVATNHIHHNKRSGSYHLIVLNYQLRKVNITTYPTGELERANREYTDIESEIKKGEPFQAVLVSAGSIKNLRSAYPNYFLDTEKFLQWLVVIESMFKKPKKAIVSPSS